MPTQRISYVDPARLTDPAMLEELDRCRREGTPRPESSAIRAHVPACFWSFANSWRDIFKNGVCDHAHQRAVPRLRVSLDQLRILRQPALAKSSQGRFGRSAI